MPPFLRRAHRAGRCRPIDYRDEITVPMTRLRGAARTSADWKLSARRLLAGDIVFEKVGVLQAGKFDGEAVFEVAHHAALDLAERDQRTDRRPLVGGDAGARFRNVDDAAAQVD